MKSITNSKSLFLALFFSLVLLVIFLPLTRAADYLITCDDSGCTSPGTAIFSQINVAPGHSFQKSFEVKNNSGKNIDLILSADKTATTDDTLLAVVDVLVTNNHGDTRFTGSLQDFLNASIDLKNIPGHKTESFFITLSLQDVGNDFQGQQAKFDLKINLTQPDLSGTTATSGTTTSTASPSPAASVLPGFSPAPSSTAVLGQFSAPGQVGPQSAFTSQGSVQGRHQSRWWLWALLPLFLFILYRLYQRRRLR